MVPIAGELAERCVRRYATVAEGVGLTPCGWMFVIRKTSLPLLLFHVFDNKTKVPLYATEPMDDEYALLCSEYPIQGHGTGILFWLDC